VTTDAPASPRPQILIIAGDVGVDAAALCHEWAQGLADALGQPVAYGRADADAVRGALDVAEVRARLVAVAAAPPDAMSSADFVYLPDGRPDWGAMWQSFCELALFGGPPHRGEDSALRHAAPSADGGAEIGAVDEIRRGIFATTGLATGEESDGWIEVACDSPKMAAWMAASILLENVDARCEGDRLYVPASPSFRLEDEVKSVITVVAKVHHYWVQHASSARPHFRPGGALV
jgi:hypothetical protein